jgi:hypothetical protein
MKVVLRLAVALVIAFAGFLVGATWSMVRSQEVGGLRCVAPPVAGSGRRALEVVEPDSGCEPGDLCVERTTRFLRPPVTRYTSCG